jgi:hypothetical protein
MGHQQRGAYRDVSDRREPAWQSEAAQQPTQQRWTVDPDDAYVYASHDDHSKRSWGHILRLLAMSLGLGAVAALVSFATDRSTTESSLLLLIPGVLAGIGSACYGIAFWWRFFQRSWWLALFWLVLTVTVKLALYVALHP